jgi:hypothetical protein
VRVDSHWRLALLVPSGEALLDMVNTDLVDIPEALFGDMNPA